MQVKVAQNSFRHGRPAVLGCDLERLELVVVYYASFCAATSRSKTAGLRIAIYFKMSSQYKRERFVDNVHENVVRFKAAASSTSTAQEEEELKMIGKMVYAETYPANGAPISELVPYQPNPYVSRDMCECGRCTADAGCKTDEERARCSLRPPEGIVVSLFG